MTEQPQIPIVPGAPAVHSPAPAVQSTPPAPQYKPKPPWLIVSIGVGITAAVLTVIAVLSPKQEFDGPPAPQAPAAADVRVSGCGRTDAGNAEAKLSITNSTSRVRDYTVTVVFNDPSGVQVGSGVTVVIDVQPGQSAVDRVIGFTGDERLAECRITSVRRS